MQFIHGTRRCNQLHSDDRVISAYQVLGEYHQQLPKLSPQRLQEEIDCRDRRSNALHARHTATLLRLQASVENALV